MMRASAARRLGIETPVPYSERRFHRGRAANPKVPANDSGPLSAVSATRESRQPLSPHSRTGSGMPATVIPRSDGWSFAPVDLHRFLPASYRPYANAHVLPIPQ